MTTLLTCTVQASRRLGLLLAVLHSLALAGLWLAALPAWARILGTAAVVLSCWRGRRAQAAITLRCEADGRLEIGQDQDWQSVEILPGSVVWPWCCTLRLRGTGFRRSLTVLSDSLDAETFRRLRVWLRWKAQLSSRPEPSAPQPAAAQARGRT